MSGEHQNRNKPSKSNKHLDQFPEQRHLTAWEIAVLERSRHTALYKYAQRRLRNEDKRREDLFWQKFGAYEASEINKNRQNRNKTSPTRLEKYEKLEERRHNRNVRFGVVPEDELLKGSERMRRRAERFGLEHDENGKLIFPRKCGVNTNVERFAKKSLADYTETVERLEKRRARFAMEPREDVDCGPTWRSETRDMSHDFMDEARMLARKKRFAEGTSGNEGRGSKKRGRRNRNRKSKNSSGREGMNVHLGEDRVGMEQTERWSSGDLQSTQEWENRGESWETLDEAGDVGGAPPDNVVVSGRVGGVMMCSQRWEEEGQEWGERMGDGREERRQMERRDAELGLQSWETRGKSW